MPLSIVSANFDDRFQTTCWTQVLSAKGDSTVARAALEELCDAYYEPVLAYLRKAGFGSQFDVRDLSHDFFNYLLEGGKMGGLDPEKGKFRCYLLGSLKHFVSHQRSAALAQKRGGGQEPFSIEDVEYAIPDTSALPPDEWFDRRWALTLLSRSLSILEQECLAAGDGERFQNLRPWLMGDAEHGNQIELANQLGIPLNTLKSIIHRLKRKFRQIVKQEISRTISDPADVEVELKSLFAALKNQ